MSRLQTITDGRRPGYPGVPGTPSDYSAGQIIAGGAASAGDAISRIGDAMLEAKRNNEFTQWKTDNLLFLETAFDHS